MSKLSLKPQPFIWSELHLEKNMLLPNTLCREKQKTPPKPKQKNPTKTKQPPKAPKQTNQPPTKCTTKEKPL